MHDAPLVLLGSWQPCEPGAGELRPALVSGYVIDGEAWFVLSASRAEPWARADMSLRSCRSVGGPDVDLMTGLTFHTSGPVQSSRQENSDGSDTDGSDTDSCLQLQTQALRF